MQAEKLIQSLIEQSKQNIAQVEKLNRLDIPSLTWRKEPASWNMLECLEHLNLYFDFYLPEIENSIKKSTAQSTAEFKSGVLGSYFSKSMLPKDKLNKMKTFKDKNPLHANLDSTTIDKFINNQLKLVDLLHKARKVNLNKVKVKISITNLVRLKLGDTFQFLTNHVLRHLKQIEGIQSDLKNA